MLGTFLQLASPLATEIAARAGFDWLLVDPEHRCGSEATLLADLQGISGSQVAAMVRVESSERLRIGRALDAGAHGIIVPRITSPEQAEHVVRFLRYPLEGVRGVALAPAAPASVRYRSVKSRGRTTMPSESFRSKRWRASNVQTKLPRWTAWTCCSSGRRT
jgi:2-keto-3-deoxy-L-rhamnonate aldolase RhmA